MDWEPAPAIAIATAQRTRARWATEDKLNQRREEGSCLRCGKNSHMIRDCKMLPAKRPLRPCTKELSAATARARTTSGLSDEEPEESGKE